MFHDPTTFFRNRSFMVVYKRFLKNPTHAIEYFESVMKFENRAEAFSSLVSQKVGFMLSDELMKELQVRDVLVIQALFVKFIVLIETYFVVPSPDVCTFWMKEAIRTIKSAIKFLDKHEVCAHTVCQEGPGYHSKSFYTCTNVVECKTTTNCLDLFASHRIPNANIEDRNEWELCVHNQKHDNYQGLSTPLEKLQKQRLMGFNWKTMMYLRSQNAFTKIFIRNTKQEKLLFERNEILTGILTQNEQTYFPNSNYYLSPAVTPPRPIDLYQVIQDYVQQEEETQVGELSAEDVRVESTPPIEEENEGIGQYMENTLDNILDNSVDHEASDQHILDEASAEDVQQQESDNSVDGEHNSVYDEASVEDVQQEVSDNSVDGEHNSVDDEASAEDFQQEVSDNSLDNEADEEDEVLILDEVTAGSTNAVGVIRRVTRDSQYIDTQLDILRSIDRPTTIHYVPIEEVDDTKNSDKRKVTDVLKDINELMLKATKPKRLDKCRKKQMVNKVNEIKMKSRISNNVGRATMFVQSVEKLYNENEKRKVIDAKRARETNTVVNSGVELAMEQNEEMEPEYVKLSLDAALNFYNKEKGGDIECFLCSMTLNENDDIFENSPLMTFHEDGIEQNCCVVQIAHSACFIKGLDLHKKEITGEYTDVDSVRMVNTVSVNKMVTMKCSACKDKRITEIYSFISKKEKKLKSFKLKFQTMICPLCLQEKVPVEHIKTCTSIGVKRNNSSVKNYEALEAIEALFKNANHTKTEILEKLQMSLPQMKNEEAFEFTYPYVLNKEAMKNKTKNKVHINLDENEKSFRVSTVMHIIKAISAIVTNLKKYEDDENKTEVTYNVMVENCKFMLGLLLKSSSTIVHKQNCSSLGCCLSGIKSKKVKKMISSGIECMKSILMNDLDFFSCIYYSMENNENEELDVESVRNNAIMNTIAYAWNFTKLNERKRVSNEILQIRSKKACDIILKGKIDMFEKHVDTIKKSNKKRKNEENVESQTKRIKITR